jgi:hypothetical protein
MSWDNNFSSFQFLKSSFQWAMGVDGARVLG